MTDCQTAAFWLALTPGDFITLKDQQTLELMMETGGSIRHGLDLRVESAWRLEEQNGHVVWVVIGLEPARLPEGEASWYLVVKAVGEEFDLKVMFVPSDFTPGDRVAVLESGGEWIFRAPKDEQNYQPEALEFADVIQQTLDDGGAIEYRLKRQGILFAGARETPTSEPCFASVVEYRADRECENPELLLLEIGEPGVICLYQGANVDPLDVDVVRS